MHYEVKLLSALRWFWSLILCYSSIHHHTAHCTVIDRVWVVRICCLGLSGVWRCCRHFWSLWVWSFTDDDRRPTGNWTHQSHSNTRVFLSVTLVHLIYSFLRSQVKKITFKTDLWVRHCHGFIMVNTIIDNTQFQSLFYHHVSENVYKAKLISYLWCVQVMSDRSYLYVECTWTPP